jgi:uncharacterized damage-inducible protein DinB
MSAAPGLVAQLENSRKYFKGTLAVFGESDSGFAPRPEMFCVAAQVRHVADTVDWFVEGAFGDGWDMDFEAHVAHAHAATSLADEVAHLERAHEAAAALIQGMSDEELFAPIADGAIMGGAPRAAVVSGILDHSAHHRGALAVYARLLGRQPAMPYS